ncbi:MAG TPA: serine/threonine-protein kinase [Albitalea sp.]|nr:serine/threonine-protein kinase [Albitalea sp.]
MSATEALVQTLIGHADTVSLAGVLLSLLGVLLYLGLVAARLAPRAAWGLSGLLAVLLLGAGWASLAIGSIGWPVWPAILALLFGQMGVGLGRAAAARPTPMPRSLAAAAPAGRVPSEAAARSAAVPAPAVPDRTTLGRYRIDRQLGRGAMGAVYLGHDPKIGRQVAIKTMALSQEFDGAELTEARARFFREAETAGRLQHRDIVTIFDAGEDQGLAYIAMEYLKGHDLQRYTAVPHLLPVPTVLNVVARVADALAYAHSQGVVHRDIKPANVMVDPAANSVKVTDFGIARITDSSRTRTGMVLGTPSFMSPEQMAGRRVDGRSDLYSLGVMLFQLLTGRLPHSADSMAKLMYQIANDPAPDVRSLRPDLPEALANVVALALEKRPEVRYADGRQLAADLRAVAAALGPAPLPVPVPAAGADAPPPESDGFAATLKLPPIDPRHNSPP